jgi:hypothetical protein
MLSVDAPLLLGVKLRPLSLGAVIHLQDKESIFISPVKTPLLATDHKQSLANLTNVVNELIVALTICSLTYEEFNDLLNDHLWVDDEQEYISMTEYMDRWNESVKTLLKNDSVNIIQSINMFNKYLENGYKKPECESVNQGGPDIINTCDWMTTLVETLTTEKNITTKEVLDQPLKLTFLQFYKIGEKNGCIHFMTDDELQMRELAVKG